MLTEQYYYKIVPKKERKKERKKKKKITRRPNEPFLRWSIGIGHENNQPLQRNWTNKRSCI
jgi:hypothetical protein